MNKTLISLVLVCGLSLPALGNPYPPLSLGITPTDCLKKRANSFKDSVDSEVVRIENRLLDWFDGKPWRYQITGCDFKTLTTLSPEKKTFYDAVIIELEKDGWCCKYVRDLDKSAFGLATSIGDNRGVSVNKDIFIVDYLEINAQQPMSNPK